ncbi:hypothetical protein [Paenibacillus sp. FSL A5-0031]|uniref:hypothetical protein n=1 Tax=Paenibacillus sp. FSL A5-0031 TaxID=1920420 RepID=UPI00118647A4|nr:hypothetical protein [Paenibacillus sp. FSL A5-0031]
MKKIFSLVMVIGLLLGIASQASAANGVYVSNPYPNSFGAVPNYIGITKPTGGYQYEFRIQEINNGSRTYYSGLLNVPTSGYDIHHTLTNSTKLLLSGGTYNIDASVYYRWGTLIGRDVVKVTFL